MVEIRIEIPDELNNRIKQIKLDVSKKMVESIRNELAKFVTLKAIASKSRMTENEAIELGRKIKKGRFEELRSKGMV